MKRALVLRREHLSGLADAELGAVAGAQAGPETSNCPDYTYYCILTGVLYCGPAFQTLRYC